MEVNKIKKKLFLLKKKLTFSAVRNYATYNKPGSILLKYWDFENNWGDTVNPYLVEKITGRKVVSSNTVFNYRHKPELLGIGSIISGDLENYVIWGSGVLSEETSIINKPRQILALRGLNSLKKIKEVGGNCNLFGDPVLLFPEVFPGSSIQKKCRYGIVPHFKDKSRIAVQQIKALNDPSIKIIDIQTGPEDFAKEVLSCENILSSSLHGLILAEAYGIPTCRLILSENLKRGDFKFYDYYSGVGIKTMETIVVHDDISKLKEAFSKCSIKDISFNKKEFIASLLNYLDYNEGR